MAVAAPTVSIKRHVYPREVLLRVAASMGLPKCRGGGLEMPHEFSIGLESCSEQELLGPGLDAELVSAAKARSAFLPKNWAAASLDAKEEALAVSLLNGDFRLVDLMQPASALFRQQVQAVDDLDAVLRRVLAVHTQRKQTRRERLSAGAPVVQAAKGMGSAGGKGHRKKQKLRGMAPSGEQRQIERDQDEDGWKVGGKESRAALACDKGPLALAAALRWCHEQGADLTVHLRSDSALLPDMLWALGAARLYHPAVLLLLACAPYNPARGDSAQPPSAQPVLLQGASMKKHTNRDCNLLRENIYALLLDDSDAEDSAAFKFRSDSESQVWPSANTRNSEKEMVARDDLELREERHLVRLKRLVLESLYLIFAPTAGGNHRTSIEGVAQHEAPEDSILNAVLEAVLPLLESRSQQLAWATARVVGQLLGRLSPSGPVPSPTPLLSRLDALLASSTPQSRIGLMHAVGVLAGLESSMLEAADRPGQSDEDRHSAEQGPSKSQLHLNAISLWLVQGLVRVHGQEFDILLCASGLTALCACKIPFCDKTIDGLMDVIEVCHPYPELVAQLQKLLVAQSSLNSEHALLQHLILMVGDFACTD